MSTNKRPKWTYEDVDEAITEFDLRRPVRAVLPAKRRVAVDLDDIETDLRCGVCLSIPRQSMTVMECLHKFCSECIEKALRSGNKKECPTCRGHCPSRRSLRADKPFDMLITSLYGADTDSAAAVEQELNQIIASESYQNFLRNQEIAREHQDLLRHGPIVVERRRADDVAMIARTIQFCMLPHPSCDALPAALQAPRRFMRAPMRMTVHHLCTYLAKRLQLLDSAGYVDVLALRSAIGKRAQSGSSPMSSEGSSGPTTQHLLPTEVFDLYLAHDADGNTQQSATALGADISLEQLRTQSDFALVMFPLESTVQAALQATQSASSDETQPASVTGEALLSPAIEAWKMPVLAYRIRSTLTS